MKGLSALPDTTTDITQQPGYQSLISLAKAGKVIIKVSGLYRSSKLTTGGYDDMQPLITSLAKEIPGSLIWASDWPHTGSAANRSLSNRDTPESFRVVDNMAVQGNIKQWVGPNVWYYMTVQHPLQVYN
jgi:predicted TIM-barrel fold metal-dependent hydrolase